MGVSHDYFRAVDAPAAVRVMDQPGGPAGRGSPWDALDGRGVDPHVVLARLVAIARGAEGRSRLLDATPVWPAGACPEHWEDLPADSPWVTGPWIEELDPAVRDALADVDNARLPDLAARWARIEEFQPPYGAVDEAALQAFLERLVQLARRARDAGERLYCWSCL
ncbi:hypothetical protein [Marinitenerispora sediminis]|uniref:DUF1877 domain-containing protein n=1 Tax=Marinitenerispora sediminis TaxID=1931232 RepID=A0A368T955_9ACTN|nr:hypothetical protein [Marinitenerispora sediminis]RCV47741.1 hypothetical protein DEF28_25455 [Marinitenerispora sediminis]RCV48260.1 hypothetical protein DEF23_25305 [Marinitenerispora sediminis]RCV60951.1 hypothetical protein DEF24_05375 [Marinitenerispora sediminis]